MKYLYKNKHWNINEDNDINKLLYLMVDRPDIIGHYGFIWTNNKNQNHRDYDLPSCVYYEGAIYNLHWYKNDKSHRENGKPAFVRYDGYKQYHTNGKFIKEENSK